MKTFVLGLTLALASLTASADVIFKNGSTELILRDTAGCTSKTVADLIVPEELGRFNDAVLTYQGKQLKACWTLDSGVVLVIDEEGDAGAIPAEAFAPYNGV